MVCQTFDGKSSSMGKMIGNMFGSPNGKGPDEKCMVDKSGGSGPYKAHYIDAPGLASHTIYAPINPPSTPLPVIIWGNGFCMSSGTMFANFLNEIASHGFFIVANGPATGNQLGGQTTYRELIKSMDWLKNPAAKKWNLDTSKLAVSGQSCGGLEAYQAASDPRIKMTVLFNSGNLGGQKVNPALLRGTVAYFLGGPKDIAQRNGDADYAKVRVPALKATIDIGHIGSYYQRYGGSMGKAAVAFFKWQQKGDATQKATFCSPTSSALVKIGFKIQTKNGLCN